MVSSKKLPILKKGEYILWTMKMKQYLAHTDYALWEVILNGNSAVQMTKMKLKASAALINLMLLILFLLLQAIVLSPQLDKEDLEQLDQDDLKETDLKWQLVLTKLRLSILTVIEEDTLPEIADKPGIQGIKVKMLGMQEEEATNFALMAFTLNPSRSSSSNSESEKLSKANIEIIGYQYGLESIEGQLRVHQQNEVIFEEKIGVLEYQLKDKSKLLKYTQKQLDEALKEKEDLKAKLEKFKTSSKNLTKLFNSQISAKVKTGLGYNSQFNEKKVLDIKEEEVTETVFDNRSSDEENSLANDRFKKGEGYHAVPSPLIGNYMPPKSDDSFAGLEDSIYKFKISEAVTSLAKDEKDTPETNTACVEMPKEDSLSHQIKDCTFHEDRMAKKSVLPINVGKGTGHRESRAIWNNVQIINHQNKFAPTSVFTMSGRIPVSAAKPKAAASTSAAKPVNTTGPKKISAVKGDRVTTVKTLAGCVWRPRSHPQQEIKNKGIVDSGCSRHMTGNKAYLADYQKINDRGFVAFGLSRGKITSKGNQTDKNAGPQDTNGNVGTQDNVDAGKEPKDATDSKTIEEPVNKEDPAYRDELDRLMSKEKEASDAADTLRKEFQQGCMDQRGVTKAGSTNSFNTVSNPVNAASTLGTFSTGRPLSPHPNAFIPANTLLHFKVRVQKMTLTRWNLQLLEGPIIKIKRTAYLHASSYRWNLKRFQVTPELTHLHDVNRIFRYLNGLPKLGLWYPIDSSFDLKTYSDSDYARENLDRKSTIREKTEENDEFHQIVDFLFTCSINYALTVVVISESSVRSDLLFNDEDGGGDIVERAITTDASLVATHDSDNVTKTQSTAMSNDPISQEIGSGDRPKCQETTLRDTDAQTRFKTASKQSHDLPLSEVNTSESKEDMMEQVIELTNHVPQTPHDSPLSGGHTPESDEGRTNLIELMNICTQMSNRVLTLEEEKTTQDKGRNDDKTEELNLNDGADTKVIVEDKGSGEKGVSTTDQVSTVRPEVNAATPSTPPTTTTIFGDEDLTISQTLITLKSEKAKEKGVAFIDVEEPPRLTRSTTTLQPLPTIDPKDKGKGVLMEKEPEKLEKVKRRDQGLAQIESDAELAQRIYEEELAELDRAQKERQNQKEATIASLSEEFDEIQARMDADHELVVRMTHEEQEKYTIKERARLLAEYFERIKKQLAAERADAIRNKPPTRTQVRNMILMDFEKEEKKSVEPESKDKKEDEIWSNQQDWNLISYKLYENCRVHTLLMDGTLNCFNMLVEKRYPLIKEMLEKMLNWKLEDEAESTTAFELLKFIKSHIKE
nr:hypothetical protein [Tanacetum cinerariifolium]